MFSKLKESIERRRFISRLKKMFPTDEDLRLLHPPDDPNDVEGWNRHFVIQAQLGFAPALYDMMVDDRDLVRVMTEEDMTSVLCAGCGVTQEPRILADAGFQVVALDLSPHAIEITEALELQPEVFDRMCGPEMRRDGGQVEFVVGDFFKDDVCPGPFDVIIERRTAQLFVESKLDQVMEALSSRLADSGILVSHCHDGGWKPPADPTYFTKPWFECNGWTIWDGRSGNKPSGRVAWLFMSTG